MRTFHCGNYYNEKFTFSLDTLYNNKLYNVLSPKKNGKIPRKVSNNSGLYLVGFIL